MHRLLITASLVLIYNTVEGQISVPSRRIGFVYENNEQKAAIEIAAYLDPTCPDSAQVFPTLLEVVQHYSRDQLEFRMHLHNLPYHRNSHVIAKATHVLDNYVPNNNTAFQWISMVFGNIHSLYNSATASMNDLQVVDVLSDMANSLTGINHFVFQTRLSSYQFDGPARLDFKYGCTRGVHSTPMFTINEVFVEADSWSVRDWKSYIDARL